MIIMNRTNRIRIFYATTMVSACLCFYMGYQVVNEYQKRQITEEETIPAETEHFVAEETEEKMSVTSVKIPYEYVIVEEEGYLLVYKKDLETVYMYTDIRMEELSEDLQSQIRRGKLFATLEELYNFLENYSS